MSCSIGTWRMDLEDDGFYVINEVISGGTHIRLLGIESLDKELIRTIVKRHNEVLEGITVNSNPMPEELVQLGHEIRTKDLVLRAWTGAIMPDNAGTVVGPVYAADTVFTEGQCVSAPILKTAQFGPALHGKGTITKNDIPGHPPWKVIGDHVSYPVVPDPSINAWRPAISGLDTE